MQIHGISQIHGPQAVNAPHKLEPTPSAQGNPSAHGADQLDISEEARLLSSALDAPEIRTEKVQQVREAIASGAYETDEKLEIALDRLLDDLVG